jgi:hypothetical protein
MTDKVFSPGEVLTAADVNNYLLNKTGSGNAIINGAFEINQRGFTSTTTNGTYTIDRFRTSATGGTSTFSLQSFSPGDLPVPGFEGTNFIRIASTGQSGSNDLTAFSQPIEDVRTFAGQTITVSFYAKASSGTPNITAFATQGFGAGGSSAVFIGSTKKAISTTWARYTFQLDIPSITGKTIGTSSNATIFICTSAGTDRDSYTESLGIQTATIDVWGFQAEVGTVATPFKRNANSLQGELAACQRYFAVLGSGAVGRATSATGAELFLSFPVEMRTSPTLAFGGNFTFIEVATAARTATNAALEASAKTGAAFTLTSSDMTSPNLVGIRSANNLQFNAEI